MAILVVVGTVVLVAAAQAFALGEPDQVSPAEGAPFTAGDQITFSARPTNGAIPAQIDFYIFEEPPPASGGAPSNFRDHFQGGPTSEDPTLYAASPDPDESWLDTPDTYYWQAVFHDCSQNPPECFVKSLARFFTIKPRPANPLPANPLLAAVATPPQTYLKKRPRHKTRKRKVKFKFRSNVAGASFRCLFASGWEDCRSPHVFRRLKPGRYKFNAQAVVNGVEDPTPASWWFRVLR
ncbi:MAG: hypothetical protein ACRDKV_02705, partial [Solirubrobacterales bacterium]